MWRIAPTSLVIGIVLRIIFVGQPRSLAGSP
jgi:hypothetical protein